MFSRMSVALTASGSSLKISFAISFQSHCSLAENLLQRSELLNLFGVQSPASSTQRLFIHVLRRTTDRPIPDRNRRRRIIDVSDPSSAPAAATTSFRRKDSGATSELVCSLPVMMRSFEAVLPAMSSKKCATGSWFSGMEAESQYELETIRSRHRALPQGVSAAGRPRLQQRLYTYAPHRERAAFAPLDSVPTISRYSSRYRLPWIG